MDSTESNAQQPDASGKRKKDVWDPTWNDGSDKRDVWDATWREDSPIPLIPRCKYSVAVVQGTNAIGCKTMMQDTTTHFPNFIVVARQALTEAFGDRKILPTALFYVDEDDIIPCPKFTLGEHIVAEDEAVLIKKASYPPCKKNQMGICIDKRKGQVKILSPWNHGGNWVEDNDKTIGLYDLVGFDFLTITTGTQMHEEYVLPNNFPAQPKIQLRAGNWSILVHTAWKNPENYNLILGAERNNFCLETAHNGTTLAVLALAEINKRQADKFAIWARLDHLDGNRYTWAYQPRNLRELVEFKALFQSDTMITARLGEAEKPAGMGGVLGIRHPNESLDTQLLLALNQTGTEARWGFDGEWLISVPNSCPNLRARADVLINGKLEKIIEEDTDPRSDILRTILGIPLRNEQQQNEVLIPAPERLNFGQELVFGAMVNQNDPVVLAEASPGAGKTYTIAEAAAKSCKKNKILCVTQSNVSLLRMVEDISPQLEQGTRCLLIQSGNAKEAYGEVAKRFSIYLTKSTIDELRGVEKKKSRVTVEKYARTMAKKAKLADEKAMASVAAQNIDFRVIFATTNMAEQLPRVVEQCEILIIDEAGQTGVNTILSLVMAMPKLRKLAMAGDPRQLGVHLADVPEPLHKYGFRSILNHTKETGIATTVKLTICYRCHPAMVQCLQHAAYGQDILPGVKAEDRAEFWKAIRMPKEQVPILLVELKGKHEKDLHSFSLANPQQTRTVRLLVNIIDSRLPPHLNITVLCLYAHQVTKLQNLSSRCQAVTTDSFQAQQSDVVIVVTTRTRNNEAEGAEAFRFVNDSARAIVALSRAQHGLVVIGDFSVLNEGEVWRKFIDQAKILTKPVGPEYVDQLAELYHTQPRPSSTCPPQVLARQQHLGTDNISQARFASPACLPNAVQPLNMQMPMHFVQANYIQSSSQSVMAQHQMALLQQQQQYQMQQQPPPTFQQFVQPAQPSFEQQHFWQLLARMKPPPPPPQPSIDQRLLELLARQPPPPPSQPQQPTVQRNDVLPPQQPVEPQQLAVQQNVRPPSLLQMQLAQNQMGSLFGPYQLPMAPQPQPPAQNNSMPGHFFFQ